MLRYEQLGSVYKTGDRMKYLVNRYYTDLNNFKNWKTKSFYQFVCLLPYLADFNGKETVQRPKYSLNKNAVCRDCDDKMILFGGFLKMKNYSYVNPVLFRFCAVSTKPFKNVHHVVIQILRYINGKLTPGKFIDPTYPTNFPNLFRSKKYYIVKPISGIIK